MNKSVLNKVLIGGVIVLGVLLIGVFKNGIYSKEQVKNGGASKPKVEASNNDSEKVQIVTTKPVNLKSSIISANQVIEVTFNYNIDETSQKFKYVIEPDVELTQTFSPDRKTIILTPKKAFPPGQGFTLRFPAGNKFGGGKALEEDINIGFKTVRYEGV